MQTTTLRKRWGVIALAIMWPITFAVTILIEHKLKNPKPLGTLFIFTGIAIIISSGKSSSKADLMGLNKASQGEFLFGGIVIFLIGLFIFFVGNKLGDGL